MVSWVSQWGSRGRSDGRITTTGSAAGKMRVPSCGSKWLRRRVSFWRKRVIVGLSIVLGDQPAMAAALRSERPSR